MENHSFDSRLIGRAENVQTAECTQRFDAKIGHALFHSLFQHHEIMGRSLTGLSISFEVASSFWKVGVSLLGGSEGMPPQKILKFRCSEMLFSTFS